jgi:transposase InsO family protein
MSSVTAEKCADVFFRRLICRHGFPKRLLTDQGPQFIAEFFRHINDRLKVKKQYTTPYHPQTNGRTEKTNRYLAVALTMYADEKQLTWDT